jgi:hypothetical protein
MLAQKRPDVKIGRRHPLQKVQDFAHVAKIKAGPTPSFRQLE